MYIGSELKCLPMIFFFYLMSVSVWWYVIKTICNEEVLSEGHLITTLLVFHKYLLDGDNPNPLGLFWIIRDWHTH